MLTLKQLTHLNAIEKHGTIHAAAEALHITQPALTRSLNNLEESLGMPLFDRHKSGMTPNDFCLHIKHQWKTILADVNDLHKAASLYQGLSVGKLNLGVGRAVRELVLHQPLPEFVVGFPDIPVQVSEGSPQELVTKLKNREIDVIFAGRGSYLGIEGLAFNDIAQLPLTVIVRPQHPLSEDGELSIGELAHYPLISAQNVQASHPLYQMQNQLNAQAEDPFHVLCSEYTALKKILLQSDAWLIAPRLQFNEQLVSGELVELSLTDYSPLYNELCAIELTDRSRTPAVDQFLKICQTHFANLLSA